MEAVSIVIPTWNGLELLQRFLPSVFRAAKRYREQSGKPVEILIVDDGGSDGTPEFVTDQQKPGMDLRLIRSPENLGFGGACNRGFEAARGPLVLLLNNDVEIDDGAISPLARHFVDNRIFAVHCQVRPTDNRDRTGNGQLGSFSRGFIRPHRGYNAGENPPAPLYSMFASGGAAMFDLEKLRRNGGFEPLLSPYYWEDVELSYRMWKRGYSVLYEPKSLAWHQFSSTTGKLPDVKVRRIQQRNRLIYHWIHLHDRRFLLSHMAWVLLLAVTAPIRDPRFLLSLWDALLALPAVRQRRQEEKAAARLSDRDVFKIFAEFERSLRQSLPSRH